MTNGDGDDIDWRTDAGGTASANTGPSQDYDPIVLHSPPIVPGRTWDLPTGTTIQANLQPGQSQNSAIYPTWIGINSLDLNKGEEILPIEVAETIYKHGIIFEMHYNR